MRYEVRLQTMRVLLVGGEVGGNVKNGPVNDTSSRDFLHGF